MKPLTLEIHGTGTHNRGAELMAIAISNRMRATFPDVRIVVQPKFGDYGARASHGFLLSGDLSNGYRRKIIDFILQFCPVRVRSILGIVTTNEIDAVLDASGFAFSDQWGARNARDLLTKMNSPARRNQPLILLPQALGPFSNPEVASASKSLFSRSNLVCARDSQSLMAAKPLCPSARLRQFPDFTLSVAPTLPTDMNLNQSFAAIVPNYRMLDKTDSGDDYITFLTHAIKKLQAESRNPTFVLHDAQEDQRVIDRVATHIAIPILKSADPRELKGILGKANLVIGSRFHALVSSLAQGIPCIGIGWSHKYEELFSDFDCRDLLATDLSNLPRLNEMLNDLSDPVIYNSFCNRILIAAGRLKRLELQMWEEVEAILTNHTRANTQ
jgi:colanic acid/amylovoran biosynthesis protein